jgi:hypothetical protein
MISLDQYKKFANEPFDAKFRRARKTLYPIGSTTLFFYGGPGCRHCAEVVIAKIVGHPTSYSSPAIKAIVEHSDGSTITCVYPVNEFHDRVERAKASK